MKRVWVPQLIASFMLLWALNPSNPKPRGFCDAVNLPLPAELQVDQPTLNEWLLNLPRRGEANSGLPWLKRDSTDDDQN